MDRCAKVRAHSPRSEPPTPDDTRPRLVTPKTVEELRAALVRAGRRGRSIIVRGGGLSLDDRALGDDLVISTARLDAIAIDEEGCELTVGPGATWGEIVKRLPPGLVPYVVVSTSSATAGGTFAADCVSRFSPAFGRESMHVKSFDLVALDGSILTCAPHGEGADVFAAVTAGVGFLGVISRITYALLDLRAIARRSSARGQLRVATEVTRCRGFEELLCELLKGSDASRGVEQAVYAVTSLDGAGAVHRSRYVASDAPLRPLPISKRPGPLRLALECAAWSSLVGAALWSIIFGAYYRVRRSFVDELFDFTFCMDGNSRAIQLARDAGVSVRLIQQTFVVPTSGDRGAAIARVAGFLRELGRLFEGARSRPALLDLLPLPARRGSNDSGLAVSIAFVPRRDADAEEVALRLVSASALAGSIGGHVHLVKSVHAAPDVLHKMHGDRFAIFFAVKKRLDPKNQLRDAFFDRVVAPIRGSSKS